MLPPSRKHPPHLEMDGETKQKEIHKPIKIDFFLRAVL